MANTELKSKGEMAAIDPLSEKSKCVGYTIDDVTTDTVDKWTLADLIE